MKKDFRILLIICVLIFELLFVAQAQSINVGNSFANPVFASGASHLCVLNDAGKAVCWGSSSSTNSPDTSFVSIAAGGRQALGLTATGAVECWGLYEELCPTDASFSFIDAGYYHACGLTEVGTLQCWGDTAEAEPELLNPPTGSFIQVSNGWFHACALAADGSVACWGDSGNNKLNPPSGVSFTQISAGRDFTCGLDSNKDIQCWGTPRNNRGQATNMSGPFAQVSSGFYHSCGLKEDGSLQCQGRVFTEPSGPLQEPADPTAAPTGEFLLLPNKMGYAHGCAVNKASLAIECWGGDYSGQVSDAPSTSILGISNTTSSTKSSTLDSTATALVDSADTVVATTIATTALTTTALATTTMLASATLAQSTEMTALNANDSVIAAGARHTCALTEAGTAVCWGRQAMGGGSYPLAGSDVYVDQPFTAIFKGTHQGYGLLPSGEILCWGENDVDQCQNRPGPYIAVSGADKHACGILEDGSLDCWGDSEHMNVSQEIAGTYSQVSSGYFHTCALDDNGYPHCWGCLQSDKGQCDISAVADTSFMQLSSGREFSCGLTTEGTINCWGDNSRGQAPASQAGPYSSFSSGSFHVCAIRAEDQQVECWGRDHTGQASPATGTYLHLASGFTFTCGINTDQQAVCWGEDTEGFIEAPSISFKK